jgi:hypothetical protein
MSDPEGSCRVLLTYLNGTTRHAAPSATHTALLAAGAAVAKLLVSARS